jgi:hypothetical protein
MAETEALAAFLDKWRARWPEWHVVEVFVPHVQRETAVAWFALRQELLDAAWGGNDATPGQAKLAWWAEELHGWGQGRRRHPLGTVLQRQPAPWIEVALATTSLAAAREPARDAIEAGARMQPFAEAAGALDEALFDPRAEATVDSLIAGLLCDQLLLRQEAAVPLQTRARLGMADTHAMERGWAQEIVRQWPSDRACGSPSSRVLAALQRERLQRAVRGSPLSKPLAAWPALWTAWRSVRA